MVLSNGAEAAHWVGNWYAKFLVSIACSKTLENRIIIDFMGWTNFCIRPLDT
jgi:hypothetical protein